MRAVQYRTLTNSKYTEKNKMQVGLTEVPIEIKVVLVQRGNSLEKKVYTHTQAHRERSGTE